MIAGRLDGRVPVEKSPSIVYSFGSMKRAFEMFPTARFLHLVSHPELYEETVMRALQRLQPLPDAHWLMKLACHPRPDGTIPSQPDPQHAWQALHRDIMHFLERVPTGQQRRARGEALLAQDGEALREVLEWLGLPADAEALECMRHPEGSPYAHRGPDSAPSGSDIFLFEGPLIPTTWSEPRCLDGFDAEVRELARELGYAARALYALEADTAPG
jgi:hypothetical protein